MSKSSEQKQCSMNSKRLTDRFWYTKPNSTRKPPVKNDHRRFFYLCIFLCTVAILLIINQHANCIGISFRSIWRYAKGIRAIYRIADCYKIAIRHFILSSIAVVSWQNCFFNVIFQNSVHLCRGKIGWYIAVFKLQFLYRSILGKFN